jgi:hypothetical protein
VLTAPAGNVSMGDHAEWETHVDRENWEDCCLRKPATLAHGYMNFSAKLMTRATLHHQRACGDNPRSAKLSKIQQNWGRRGEGLFRQARMARSNRSRASADGLSLGSVDRTSKKLCSRPGKLKEIDVNTWLKCVSESQKRRGQSWKILGNPEEMVGGQAHGSDVRGDQRSYVASCVQTGSSIKSARSCRPTHSSTKDCSNDSFSTFEPQCCVVRNLRAADFQPACSIRTPRSLGIAPNFDSLTAAGSESASGSEKGARFEDDG